MPVRWLLNQSLRIRRGAEVLNIVGLDQQHYNQADLPQALRYADPAGVVILLAHYPFALLHAWYAHVDLVLAGHTHGGQIRLPGIPFFTNDQLGWRHGLGISRLGKTQMVVCSGLGYSGPFNFRLFTKPEIGVIVLHCR